MDEYAGATMAHIGLDSKLRLAALGYDDTAVRELTIEVENAAAIRDSARDGFGNTRRLTRKPRNLSVWLAT